MSRRHTGDLSRILNIITPGAVVETYAISTGDAIRDGETIEHWENRAFDFWVDVPRNKGKVACVAAIPGYDDTTICKPGMRVPRQGLYKLMWKQALEVKPDWVLICSFNEWHEGSEIEPSVELGT